MATQEANAKDEIGHLQHCDHRDTEVQTHRTADARQQIHRRHRRPRLPHFNLVVTEADFYGNQMLSGPLINVHILVRFFQLTSHASSCAVADCMNVKKLPVAVNVRLRHR